MYSNLKNAIRLLMTAILLQLKKLIMVKTKWEGNSKEFKRESNMKKHKDN